MGTQPLSLPIAMSLPPQSLPTTVSPPRAPISRADHNLPAADSLMNNVKTSWVLLFLFKCMSTSQLALQCLLWLLLCK